MMGEAPVEGAFRTIGGVIHVHQSADKPGGRLVRLEVTDASSMAIGLDRKESVQLAAALAHSGEHPRGATIPPWVARQLGQAHAAPRHSTELRYLASELLRMAEVVQHLEPAE